MRLGPQPDSEEGSAPQPAPDGSGLTRAVRDLPGPERAFAAFDLYCCRERPDWGWRVHLAELVGASEVVVRRIARGDRSP